jgi:hypothetical protein
MLARLQGLGLVENTGPGQARGQANAWRLTAWGEEVREAVDRPARGYAFDSLHAQDCRSALAQGHGLICLYIGP